MEGRKHSSKRRVTVDAATSGRRRSPGWTTIYFFPQGFTGGGTAGPSAGDRNFCWTLLGFARSGKDQRGDRELERGPSR